ncbi:MAG: zinc-ribbon domain-containing protein [Acidobacteriota bacterium]
MGAAGETKFCFNCGTKIPRAAKFCGECGSPQPAV